MTADPTHPVLSPGLPPTASSPSGRWWSTSRWWPVPDSQRGPTSRGDPLFMSSGSARMVLGGSRNGWSTDGRCHRLDPSVGLRAISFSWLGRDRKALRSSGGLSLFGPEVPDLQLGAIGLPIGACGLTWRQPSLVEPEQLPQSRGGDHNASAELQRRQLAPVRSLVDGRPAKAKYPRGLGPQRDRRPELRIRDRDPLGR